jgi:hypothetical protein
MILTWPSTSIANGCGFANSSTKRGYTWRVAAITEATTFMCWKAAFDAIKPASSTWRLSHTSANAGVLWMWTA